MSEHLSNCTFESMTAVDPAPGINNLTDPQLEALIDAEALLESKVREMACANEPRFGYQTVKHA
jgi:hypothetical protein